jgi:uncharacterized membrane protein YebE (DUF533 family)
MKLLPQDDIKAHIETLLEWDNWRKNVEMRRVSSAPVVRAMVDLAGATGDLAKSVAAAAADGVVDETEELDIETKQERVNVCGCVVVAAARGHT